MNTNSGCTDVEDIATLLLCTAFANGQAVVRCDDLVPVDEVRQAVRRMARETGVQVRTAMLEDVLVVARVDLPLWMADDSTMRREIAAPVQAWLVA